MSVFPGFILLLIFAAQRTFSSEDEEAGNMLLNEFQVLPGICWNMSDTEEAVVMRRQSPGLAKFSLRI